MLGRRLAENLLPVMAQVGARKRDDEERKRSEEDRAEARRMREIQQAALLAGMREQGIVPESERETAKVDLPDLSAIGGAPRQTVNAVEPGRYTPLTGGMVLDTTRTRAAQERAKTAAAERARRESVGRRVSTLRALVPELANAPDDAVMAIAEDDDAFQDRVKFRTPDKPERPFYDNDRGVLVGADGKVTKPDGLPARPASPGNQYRDLSAVGSIRGQFNSEPTVKAAQDVASSLVRVRQAAQNPSPAGDLALIFSYMKMLDPGSTVREGEFANAQNAAGVPDQVRNAYNRASKGERLNPQQRQDFFRQAERQAEGQRRLLSSVVQRYTGIARRNGLDPRDVVFDPFESGPTAGGGSRSAVPYPEY